MAALLLVVMPSTVVASETGWRQVDRRPAPRYGHRMVFDEARHRVVMFGGQGESFSIPWDFDGVSWSPGPEAPISLRGAYSLGMAFDSWRRVTVVFEPAAASAAQTWEYDGRSWEMGVPPPPGTIQPWDLLMAFDRSRGVSVVRGRNGQEVWEYDGTGWRQGPDSPYGLTEMVYDPKRSLIVGCDLRRLWTYDGSGWVASDSVPSDLLYAYDLVAGYDSGRGRLVLLSRQSHFGVWEYDGAIWTPGAPFPIEMPLTSYLYDEGPAAAYDSDRQRLVLWGGRSPFGHMVAPSVWEYDGVQWYPGGAFGLSPPPLDEQVLVYDRTRKRLILFSAGQWNQPCGVWERAGTDWLPSPAVGEPCNLRSPTLVYDRTRDLSVLFGVRGRDNEVWEYDGQRWAMVGGVPLSMGARSGQAMSYDARRSRVVVMGGHDLYRPTLLNDTWEYDGSGWTFGADAPANLLPRRDHDMVFDDARGVTTLFGGNNDRLGWRPLVDTWSYDGRSWVPGASSPPGLAPRADHRLTYDEARARIIMFGGWIQDAGGRTLTDETWEYDGARWTRGLDAPPWLLPAAKADLAYDADRRIPVMFDRGLTWEYVRGDGQSYGMGMGHGPPNENRVRIRAADGGPTGIDFLAYAAGSWGVNVAAGDVDGVAGEEILTGPGPGPPFGPQVRAFERDGSPTSVNLFAFGTLKFGVNPESTHLDGDIFEEIVAGAGPGAVFGPQVRGYEYDGSGIEAMEGVNYFAYAWSGFGVNVGAGDVDRDGYGELLTGPGPRVGFAPRVRGWDYDAVAVSATPGLDFHAFSFGDYGVRVRGGDVTGDGAAEIVATPGPGPFWNGWFAGFSYDGAGTAVLPGFTLGPSANRYGGRVGLGDLDGDGADELLAGAGPDPTADSSVRAYVYDGVVLTPLSGSFVAFPGSGYGVNVAGAGLGY